MEFWHCCHYLIDIYTLKPFTKYFCEKWCVTDWSQSKFLLESVDEFSGRYSWYQSFDPAGNVKLSTGHDD